MTSSPSDRDTARQWLKDLIAREPPILGQIARLHKDAHLAAIRARRDKRKRSGRDRLRGTRVTELLRKDADANPMRLTGAGIFTADHVLELGASKLRARAGIDADMAAKWVYAARDLKRARDGDEIPPPRPADWTDEDVNLVRTLLVLDSATMLRNAPHTQGLAYPTEHARALLAATSWLRWKAGAARRAGVLSSVGELAEWVSSDHVGENQSQVENHLARHLARVAELRDPGEVARAWGYQREDLLELLRTEVP